jgi:AraC-like DNA-binding protein
MVLFRLKVDTLRLMNDRLSALLQRFSLRAEVVHAGLLAQTQSFEPRAAGGVGSAYLHLVQRGTVELQRPGQAPVRIDEPSVLLMPRTAAHALRAGAAQPPSVISAAVGFGASDDNPLLRGLPDLLQVPLAALPGLAPAQQLLCAESAHQRCGHAAVVDRLIEVLVIQLLRFAIERRLVAGGVMAGLADARLNKLLNAVHADPSHGWTLDQMARVAGMSRARFAAHFARTVGTPPGEYLTVWRLGVARSLLRQGRAVKQVAHEVGYANASALARVFGQRLGLSPTDWMAQAQAEPSTLS